MSPRSPAGAAFVLALGASLTFAGAAAQEAVRLAAPAEALVLPLPAGSTRVLTVQVERIKPRSVWLATREEAAGRVLLRDAGEGKYRIDLGDPAVAALLRVEGVEGKFRVFVEADSGKVAASEPVAWSFRAEPADWRAIVWSGDHRTKLGPGMHHETWFQPEKVLKIDVEGPKEADAPRVFARSGDREWPLARAAGRNAWVLETASAVREAWSAAGELTFSVEGLREQHAQITARAKPSRLRFEGETAQLTIVQRKSAPLPGSNGYLILALDDITHGQVLVEVNGADGAAIVGQRTVRQGDEIPILVGDQAYTIVLDRLVNLVIGEDYATFSVHATEPAPRRQIEALLRRVETSEVVLLREGREYGGVEAASHLRRKHAAAGEDVKTLDDFIMKIASYSATTGSPYLVRTKDGKTVPAEAWLRGLAAGLGEKAASRAASH